MVDRVDPDREDRERNRVGEQDVGTAASASVDGQVPSGVEGERKLTAPAGAAGGAAAGFTAGTVVLGPVGGIIGAIAGAVGGGWIGLASGKGTEGQGWDDGHDASYRAHYDADEQRIADRSYDDARVAYQLGHFAAANPDYAGRDWEAVEADLRHGWTSDVQQRHGAWEQASRHARAAFEIRRRQPIGRGYVETEMSGTESHQRAAFSDPIPPGDPDNVAGEARRIPGREE